MNKIIIPPGNELFKKLCIKIEERRWIDLQKFIRKNGSSRAVKLNFMQYLKYVDRHVFGWELGCRYKRSIRSMQEYKYLKDKKPTHVKLLNGWGLEFSDDGSLIFFQKETKKRLKKRIERSNEKQ